MKITLTKKLHLFCGDYYDSNNEPWVCSQWLKKRFDFPEDAEKIAIAVSTSPSDPESVRVYFSKLLGYWRNSARGHNQAMFYATIVDLDRLFADQPKRELYITLYYWE